MIQRVACSDMSGLSYNCCFSSAEVAGGFCTREYGGLAYVKAWKRGVESHPSFAWSSDVAKNRAGDDLCSQNHASSSFLCDGCLCCSRYAFNVYLEKGRQDLKSRSTTNDRVGMESSQPSLLLLLSYNASNLTLNEGVSSFNRTTSVSVGVGVNIACPGPLFTSPSFADACQQAWRDIPTFPNEDYTFGTRGLENVMVPLPFRFISSMDRSSNI